ncbi:hypothetical protein BC835DRAFT_100010 [Cytidiella melzeri]|nr:hypothetical protein BC835DRAFT_100010 [Cytidiella melzeri]
MADDTRARPSYSHIPVMTPRPSQSSLPSSLSSPQLGLVPQGRFLAVSGSPSYPAVSGSSTNSSSGGMSSFRTFRNLLPFGPSKNTSGSPTSNSNPATPTRSSSGPLRRSVNGERSVSAPHLPVKRQDEPPVLTIQLSHRVDEPLFDTHELRNKLGVEPSTPESVLPSPLSSAGSFHVVEQPLIVASDLSTILEADTSGISKHPPSPKSLQHTHSCVSLKTVATRPSNPNIQDTSALDLSTTDIGKEVLAALSATGQKDHGWLNGAIVEDVESPAGDGIIADPDASFNLGALDHDLATLLKSNRPKDIESPPLLTPPLTDGRRGSRSPSPHLTTQGLASPCSAPSTATNSPTLSQRQAAPSSSMSRSSSLSRPITLKPPPSSLARLSRSASERPSYFSKNSPLPSPTKLESTRRQSLQLSADSKSPLLREEASPTRPTTSDGAERDHRKQALSRLAAPSRHLAAANNARTSLRHLPSPTSSPGWDGGDSVSSRSPSAIGAAPTRRVNGHRPSLDTGNHRPPIRGRDRSASLTEHTPYYSSTSRPPDWMGPRTAKVFAAAGLLQEDRDSASPSTSRPGHRYGITSSRSDRDFRSQYAPSRAGFSEVGSTTSWGRRSGSISHTCTSSEARSAMGTPLSDSVMTTPRTTYSAASTAPTSVSTASSMQKHLESEIQQLQSKHSTETGALLNALADSQRTTRILREENAQLRDRVQYLSDELEEAQETLKKLQFSPPFATSTLPRSTSYRLNGRQPPESLRRPIPHSRLQTLIHVNDNDDEIDNNHMEDARHESTPMNMPMSSTLSPHHHEAQRRYSSSSSIFASLPSNMPMLLQEDDDVALSMSPPSPAMHTGRLPSKQVPYVGHRRTTSSTGNISPTTANFSMMTGSPRSLDLRSEHERLLGDMPSLDLHGGDYDSRAFQDL